MSNVRLSTAAKQLLRNASSVPIRDYFISFPAHEKRTKWIRQNNRYRRRCTEQYFEDLDLNTVSDDDLIAYVAASAPTHAIDGWSFLGRAVAGALRGDAYSAVHFAYYAELRAAMSLLASQGIGIFSNRHPVVRSNATTALIPRSEFRSIPNANPQLRWVGTHAIAWPLLRHWSSLQRSGSILSEIVRPKEIPLSQWLDACGAITPTRELGRLWLEAWGIDLSFFEDDRGARNLTSYRPSEFRRPMSGPIPDVLEFVEQLWSLFEPSPNARFPVLERLLLRRALRAASVGNLSANAIGNLGFPTAESESLVAFLNSPDEPRPLILAEQRSAIEDADSQLEIISRAALLLYFASGATRRLLKDADYSSDILEFWWRRHGLRHGLWETLEKVEDPFDAWADVNSRLEDSRTWRAGAALGISLRDCRLNVPICIDQFGAFELVAIWSLLP